MKLFLRQMIIIILLQTPGMMIQAQPKDRSEAKPYKIITTGKRVTIKSTRPLKTVMLWTTGGYRVVEQRGINLNSYSFTISLLDKIYFLMFQTDDEKVYTERIGIK